MEAEGCKGNMAIQPTILLVDGDPLERNSLSLTLKQEGYLVTSVEDSLSALSLMEKEQFDVALADIGMPYINGMDLLRQIGEGGIPRSS